MSLAFSMVACAISVFTFIFNIVIPEKFRDPVLRAKRRIEALEDLKNAREDELKNENKDVLKNKSKDELMEEIKQEIKIERAKEYAYMHKSPISRTMVSELLIFVWQAVIFAALASYCTSGKGAMVYTICVMVCSGLATFSVCWLMKFWDEWTKSACHFLGVVNDEEQELGYKIFWTCIWVFAYNIVYCLIVTVLYKNYQALSEGFWVTGFGFSVILPVWIVYNAASKQVECMVLEQDRKSLEK